MQPCPDLKQLGAIGVLDIAFLTFKDGRRFQILAAVHDFKRENLALVADTLLSGLRFAHEFDRIIAIHGVPGTIVSDNGTEFTSMAILKWVHDAAIDWHYIASRCPAAVCLQTERGR